MIYGPMAYTDTRQNQAKRLNSPNSRPKGFNFCLITVLIFQVMMIKHMVNVKKLNFWISEELILVLNALQRFTQEEKTNGKSSKLIKLSMLSWNCLASTMFSLLRPTMSVLVQMNLMKSNMSPTSNQL